MPDKLNEDQVPFSHEEAVEFAAKEQKRITTNRTIAGMSEKGVSQTKLMGNLADLAQFSAFGAAVAIHSLGKHGNADQKKIISETNTLDPAAAFIEMVQSDELAIPALKKDIQSVLQDFKKSVDAYLASVAVINKGEEQGHEQT